MKRLVVAVALVGGSLHNVALAGDAPVKCFFSPEDVQEAHPGSHAAYTTHATWWTESSKCWFVGKPVTKPTTKPHAGPTIALAPSAYMSQALSPRPKHASATAEEAVAIPETYEQSAATLRSLMFGEGESATNFEGRFSAIRNTRAFYLWRRCFASPNWDLCESST